MGRMVDIALRRPCRCGWEFGRVEERNGQNTVRCEACGTFQYNAPKTETGERQRTVSTVHAAITPKVRARVIERAKARCELCGANGILHVGHVLSVKDGMAQGLDEQTINGADNLIACCEECNLGFGARSLPLYLAVAILKARK